MPYYAPNGTRRALLAQQAQKPVHPASVSKVPTTLALLRKLGPDYRFVTTFSAQGAVSEGTLHGNLLVESDGDPAFVEQVARVIADESAGVGADFPFAPVIAVARDERWGRTYEAFGETPDPVSAMGVAMIKGLQFPTGGTKISILANAKHYVGDGGTANGVTGGPVTGNEATLRALHLAPYRAAVAARVGSAMAGTSTRTAPGRPGLPDPPRT